eukprot:2971457-Amphidinium_carterae.1
MSTEATEHAADSTPVVAEQNSSEPLPAVPQTIPPRPQAPLPLFSTREFAQLASLQLPRLAVVDVGAMLLDEAEDVWVPLLRGNHCEKVFGFEPNAEECDKLNAEMAARQAASGKDSCEC